MDIKNNFIGGGDSSSEKYNKDTYIGYLKMKKGGMKIISGYKDEQIIATRNKILSHLDIVLSGGKRLKEKNIKKYFKALGGKYVRNDMCISGDNSNCKNGRNVSVRGAHKLLKLISKKNLPIDSSLETFKGSAPELYEKLENKIKGGYNAIAYDSDSNKSNKSTRSNKSSKSSNTTNNATDTTSIKKDDDNNKKKNNNKDSNDSNITQSPYSSLLIPTICSSKDHVKAGKSKAIIKNCSDNPWCLYGLGIILLSSLLLSLSSPLLSISLLSSSLSLSLLSLSLPLLLLLSISSLSLSSSLLL
jgi:hypothetical protein